MAMLYTLYLCKLPLLVVMKVVSWSLGGRYYTKTIYTFLFSSLFFTEILTILLEGFIEFLVAAYLNVLNNEPIETASGEIIAKYLIYSVLPLLLVALPLA
jgi:hypothetical protein